MKKRAHRARITFETDPALSAFLINWAREEDRTLSALVRRVLTKVADERARNATRKRNAKTAEQYATP
jgi:hypothetical protein